MKCHLVSGQISDFQGSCSFLMRSVEFRLLREIKRETETRETKN